MLTGLFQYIEIARNKSWHITIAANASSTYHLDCNAEEPMCQSTSTSIVTIEVDRLAKQLLRCCDSIDKVQILPEKVLAPAL